MATEAERWEQLQTLFHLVAETPEADRERVLAAACADPDLRRQVMEIFIAGEVEYVADAETATVLMGKIGPYTLLRLLG